MRVFHPVILSCVLLTAACVAGGTTNSSNEAVSIPATKAPAQATVRVSTPGRSQSELARDMLCTPSSDAQSRGLAAIAEIDSRVAALGTSLSVGALGRRTEEIWNDVGEETGCWFERVIYAGSAIASVTVAPGELALHAYRPAGTIGVPTGATANCIRTPGQSAEDALANARNAAAARLSEFDRIQTAFEKQVEIEGSAAFQNSDTLAQITASRDAIRAEYNCRSVFLDVPVVQ